MVELMDAGECDANAKMQQSGETFLHIAASHGDMDTCKYLIDLGANLNARTDKVSFNSPTTHQSNQGVTIISNTKLVAHPAHSQ